jgi:N-acetylmuramoyl-L-alanine amidase
MNAEIGQREQLTGARIMRSGRTKEQLFSVLALTLVCAACGTGTALRARESAVRNGNHNATAMSRTVVRLPAVVGQRAVVPRSGSSGGQEIDPSVFSRGACVSFAPVSPARHMTVFLDAGHGGLDPGAVGTTESGRTIYEAQETLAVELDVMSILRRDGFSVVVSRTRASSVLRLRRGDTSGNVLTVRGSHVDVLARVTCANDAHANVLVGIYFNSGAPNNAGAVTGYDPVRPFAADNLRLARLLQTDALAAMNAHGWRIPDAGVQSDVRLGSALSSTALAYGHLVLLGPADPGYVPKPSRMPGALIEPLFITDPFEGSIAASGDGQRVIAGALARAIEQYFGHGS